MNILKVTAAHEAGHAIVAFCTGYGIRQIVMDYDGTGTLKNGAVHYDFGADADIVTSIYNSGDFKGEESERDRWIEIAYKRINIVLGAIATENIYSEKNGRKMSINHQEYAGDIDIIQKFSTFLLNSDPAFDRKYIETEGERIQQIFETTDFQNAVTAISDSILKQKGISGMEVEGILKEMKVFDYLRTNNIIV